MSHGEKKKQKKKKKNTGKPADNKSSQNVFLRMGNDRKKKKKSLFFTSLKADKSLEQNISKLKIQTKDFLKDVSTEEPFDLLVSSPCVPQTNFTHSLLH